MSDDHRVLIISPATREAEVFNWVPCKAGEIKDENAEIVEIISWIVCDIRELSSNRILENLLKDVDRSSLNSVRSLCDSYNSEINKLWCKWNECDIKPEFLDVQATRDHLQFILLQCYNRAVSEPDKLNQYQPFSPQVYGETSFELICQMLETVKISAEDTFIDLGSGVGQVVLQVAALSNAKLCSGIEKAEYPALCASKLDRLFRHWMKFYGKSYRPYSLERGDFLTTEYQERIVSATVLFANNFAFGPEVDHQLKQRFANLKEGARIISSKAFCSLNFRITDRNLGDIGSIMQVSCLNPIQDAVSWTDKPFSYFVHVIDRSLLERYFARLKNPKQKDDDQTIRRDRKGRIISDVPKSNPDQSKIAHEYSNSIKTIIPKRYTVCRTIRQLPKRSSSLPNTNRNRRSRMSNGFTVVTPRKNYIDLQVDQKYVDKSDDQHTTSLAREVLQSRSRTHTRHSHGWSSRRRLSASEFRKSRKSQKILPSSKSFTSSFDKDKVSNGSLCELNSKKHSTTTSTGHSSSSLTCGKELSKSLFSTSGACTADGLETSFSPHLLKQNASFLYGKSESDDHSSSGANHESRNSSSSPCTSFSPSATRSSPCSQLDETLIPTSKIEGGMKHLKLDQISSATNNRKYANYDDGHHIRIKLSLTKSTDRNRSYLKSEDSDTNRENCTNHPDDDTSVAKRRVIRKCRQMLQENTLRSNSNSTNHADMTYGQIVRRCVKRLSLRSRNQTPNKVSNGRMMNNVIRPKKPVVQLRVHKPNLQSNQNLVYMHSETVAQVKSTLQPCQNGLNHPEMAGFTQHYVPRNISSLVDALKQNDMQGPDPSIGHIEQPVPLALTQYLELTKQAFMDHFAMLRSPEYLSLIKSQVEKEQARQAELWEHSRLLEQTIAKLHADGTELLNRFTKRLGILISTPANFFAQARKLIKHHHLLEEKIADSRRQISELSAANQELVRRHRLEAARLLSAASVKSEPPICTNPLRQRQTDCDMILAEKIDSKPKNNLSCHAGFSMSEIPVIPPPPPLTKVSTVSDTSKVATHYSQSLLVSDHLESSKIPSRFHLSEDLPGITFSESTDTTSIPPPPPLLPMHCNLPPILHSNNISHNQQDNGALSHDHLLKNTLLKTDVSSPNKLFSYPNKSMHSSFQDLIADEFSRSSCENSPRSTSGSLRGYSSFRNTSSSIVQNSLPLRKRTWDSSDGEYTARKSSKHNSYHLKSNNLSPPTLSPVAIEFGSCNYDLETSESIGNSDLCDKSESSKFLGLLPPPLIMPNDQYSSGEHSRSELLSLQSTTVIPLMLSSQAHRRL